MNYLNNIIKIAKTKKNINFIFSSSNFDVGGHLINKFLERASKNFFNIFYVKSFGQENLFSLYKIVDGIIGNSSSGVIEFPSFKKPIINIGNRQMGRIYSPLIIQSNGSYSDLKKNIDKIINQQINTYNLKNIYQKKNTLNNCLNRIKVILNSN